MQEGYDNGNNQNAPRKKSTSAISKMSMWLLSAGLCLTFIFLDSIQKGEIEYKEIDGYCTDCVYSNSFTCGFSTIKLSCQSYGNLCDGISMWSDDSNIKFDRRDVNASYNEMYSYIFFVSTLIGCAIPWLLLSLLFAINMDKCTPKNGHGMYEKCFVLCLISMLLSIVAVVFGIMLTEGTQNCSDGLYDYIEFKMGNEWKNYEWTNSKPDVKYGLTLIFMMANCALTFAFTICCYPFINQKPVQVRNEKSKLDGYQRYDYEGQNERPPSASKFGMNPNDEGV